MNKASLMLVRPSFELAQVAAGAKATVADWGQL
jgi:hypothetical protein